MLPGLALISRPSCGRHRRNGGTPRRSAYSGPCHARHIVSHSISRTTTANAMRRAVLVEESMIRIPLRGCCMDNLEARFHSWKWQRNTDELTLFRGCAAGPRCSGGVRMFHCENIGIHANFFIVSALPYDVPMWPIGARPSRRGNESGCMMAKKSYIPAVEPDRQIGRCLRPAPSPAPARRVPRRKRRVSRRRGQKSGDTSLRHCVST